MKSSFLEKFLGRVGRLGSEDVQAFLVRLAKEKHFLETIFNTLQEGVLVLDSSGKIEYQNRAAMQLLSLPEEGGVSISRYLKDVEWGRLLKEEVSVSKKLEIYYPEKRVLEFYLVPIAQDDESRKSFVVIFHDITQEQQHAMQTLESERLGALTILAAGVAHELGNPLNSLNIHLQLMERDINKAPPEVAKSLRESVGVARSEIDRLDSIITQFLRAVRPTLPELKPGNVADVLDQTLKLLKLELDNRDILCEREVPAGLPEVLVDGDQLRQAFFNIIRNAAQAIGKGGILKIMAFADDNWLVVSFSDTGEGISSEDMPHVFQPYFTTKEGGNGLGLIIVQRVVREHGGELELESERGRGTVVRVKLPLRQRRMRMLENKPAVS